MVRHLQEQIKSYQSTDSQNQRELQQKDGEISLLARELEKAESRLEAEAARADLAAKESVAL